MQPIDVTVLMPVYNGALYISEAIASVLGQSFRDFELLIIDDGSTDKTCEIVKTFSDMRIRLLQRPHRGFAETLNHGLREAKGKYIARFDADDICMPDRLAVQYAFMNSNPGYVLIGSQEEYIDQQGEYIFTLECPGYTNDEIRSLDPIICPFSHTSVMYRKDVVLEAGGYYNKGHSFEDHMLWLQVIKKGKVCNLQQPLVKYRFNPASMTIDEKWRGLKFRQLKASLLHRGYATETEHRELSQIMKSQELSSIKEGAYYALCGKKFLFNNRQPRKARANLVKAIRSRPLRADNYALYLLSYFPGSFLEWLYRKQKTRAS